MKSQRNSIGDRASTRGHVEYDDNGNLLCFHCEGTDWETEEVDCVGNRKLVVELCCAECGCYNEITYHAKNVILASGTILVPGGVSADDPSFPMGTISKMKRLGL